MLPRFLLRTTSIGASLTEALDDSYTILGMEDAFGVVRLQEGFNTSGSYPNDSYLDVFDSKGTPRADIFEQDIPGGFTGLTLLDTNFLTNKINRAGFIEPLDGSNPLIFFNDSTNKSIGSGAHRRLPFHEAR